MLKIKNLTKKYGNLIAVNNLNITVQKGSVLGVLGPNGSGKTTTLSCILGLIAPTSGTFSWFNLPDGQLENKRIGAIIEQPNFYPYLSAERNIKIIAEIRNVQDADNEIIRVLKKVNLLDRKDSAFSTFSFGMKRRLAIAGSLLGNPEVLIYDEPTNGLDPKGIAFVRNLILNEAQHGKTIILASHIIDEVEKVCTDVMILKKGNLIVAGKVSEVLSSDEKIHIKSEDNKKLQEILTEKNIISSAEINENTLIVVLNEDVKIRKISEIAMDNHIIITNLQTKKKSLETEFLERIG